MICEKFNTQEPLIGNRIVGVQKSESTERGREGQSSGRTEENNAPNWRISINQSSI